MILLAKTMPQKPTLVLPPRYAADTLAVGRAAGRPGWQVERLPAWRVPAWLAERDVVLYGEPLFAAAVAEALRIELIEPPFGWLPDLPEAWRKRDVRLTDLASARAVDRPAFIKPADDKCLSAQVYAARDALPSRDVLPDATPVLIAEPVEWEVEFRCFVLEGEVVTSSPYLRNGRLARDESGEWAASDAESDAAVSFCRRFLDDAPARTPPACVVDVGVISGRGWAVVEANAAWGSGIYGCDPVRVLPVLRRATLAAGESGAADRPWILQR